MYYRYKHRYMYIFRYISVIYLYRTVIYKVYTSYCQLLLKKFPFFRSVSSISLVNPSHCSSGKTFLRKLV